jgi:hypothetical protein
MKQMETQRQTSITNLGGGPSDFQNHPFKSILGMIGKIGSAAGEGYFGRTDPRMQQIRDLENPGLNDQMAQSHLATQLKGIDVAGEPATSALHEGLIKAQTGEQNSLTGLHSAEAAQTTALTGPKAQFYADRGNAALQRAQASKTAADAAVARNLNNPAAHYKILQYEKEEGDKVGQVDSMVAQGMYDKPTGEQLKADIHQRYENIYNQLNATTDPNQQPTSPVPPAPSGRNVVPNPSGPAKMQPVKTYDPASGRWS